MAKKKKAEDLTTDEAIKKLFPKKVIKKVKDVMKEKEHRPKPPKE